MFVEPSINKLSKTFLRDRSKPLESRALGKKMRTLWLGSKLRLMLMKRDFVTSPPSVPVFAHPMNDNHLDWIPSKVQVNRKQKSFCFKWKFSRAKLDRIFAFSSPLCSTNWKLTEKKRRNLSISRYFHLSKRSEDIFPSNKLEKQTHK